jgi:hypothetical protein
VTRKPRLFVGSSVESLGIAYGIQENLDYDAECTVWTQGIFRPTQQTLEALVRTLGVVDFAAFAFTPEDLTAIRGQLHAVVRDNVIFELGLFMGRLGPERCFIVAPRSTPQLHLPSDLLGLALLTYDDRRSDGNELAALAAACNAIRRELRNSAGRSVSTHSAGLEMPIEAAEEKLRRLEVLWNGDELQRDREMLRAGIPMSMADDEKGEDTAALKRVYAFLNAVADTLLGHLELESRGRAIFETAMRSVWGRVFAYFTPPSGDSAEMWGDDLPPVAKLMARWA